MKTNFQSEKGVSILLSVMILSVVLSIALGSSNIAIRQSQSMEGIGENVVAFYAADYGIEEAMLQATPTSATGTISFSDGSEATYNITVLDSSDPTCSADSYCIQSIGTYKETKRGIQSNY